MSCNGWLTSTCVKKMQLTLIRRNSGKMGMPVKWNGCSVYCHLNRTATSEQFTFFKCHMKNKITPRSKANYVVAASTAFSWHELRDFSFVTFRTPRNLVCLNGRLSAVGHRKVFLLQTLDWWGDFSMRVSPFKCNQRLYYNCSRHYGIPSSTAKITVHFQVTQGLVRMLFTCRRI